MPEAPAHLLLVRHGQIQANLDRVWHGSTDSALTQQGREEAQAAGRFLAAAHAGAAALYTSPLERARATADAISGATGLEPISDPGIGEFGIGDLEGESYASLYTEHLLFEKIRDPNWAPPGGESVGQVLERVIGAFQRIAGRHPGREVIVVSHGAAMGLALAHLIDGDAMDWQKYHKHNCGVSEFVLEPAPSLVHFDQIEHLP